MTSIALSQTHFGEIHLCRNCKGNLSFRFNNIFQMMSAEEFQLLYRHIESVDINGFFESPPTDASPEEPRIYLSTTVGPLYFCFTQNELCHLQTMLQEAMNRLNTLEKAWTELN